MKRIDIQGLGVWIEIFKRQDGMTDDEAIKEAYKTLQREFIKREAKTVKP